MMKKTIKRGNSLAKRNLHKFLSNKLAIAGVIIIVFILCAVLFAPLITKHDPTYSDTAIRLQKPSSEHILGTDNIGRDAFSRVLFGGRYSILIGLSGAIGSTLIGVIFGCISGYYGGKADAVILYISELFMSFPQMLLILLLVAVSGRGISNLILIFSITGWTHTHRIVRSKMFSLREESFVESCVANGVGGVSIMFRHLMPNTLGPVMVTITLQTAEMVLAEAALSFIGLGVEANIPTWGTIINAVKSLTIMQHYPALWLAPGIAITLFVLGINFLGDGLRDVYDAGQ